MCYYLNVYFQGQRVNFCFSSWNKNWVLCTCESPPGPWNHSPTVLRVTSLIISLEKFVLLDNDGYLTAEEISSICGTQKLITIAAKSLVDAFLHYCSFVTLSGLEIAFVLLFVLLGFLRPFREIYHLNFNLKFAWPCIIDINNIHNHLDATITAY